MGAMEIIEENEKIVVLKDGKEVECDILFTFDSEDTGKSYIGYTDNSIASNGRKNIFVSSFDPIIGTGSFDKKEEFYIWKNRQSGWCPLFYAW